MTSLSLNISEISNQFWLDFQIVKSWWQHMNFANFDEAKSFFEINKNMINAKPFIKWVWGKKQILPQLQKLFPIEFNNYHEPFLWGWAVFFNIQKK